MIKIPTKGMARSINTHNVDLNTLTDWVEASVAFLEEELSRHEIIDRLIEEEIYDNQDLASEMIENLWGEIERRLELCGGSYSIEIDGAWLRQKGDWEKHSAHIFCLLLSLSTTYDWWMKEFGHDYTEQGELFELLTDNALQTLSPGWKTYRTGWSRVNTDKFNTIAREVTRLVGNEPPEMEIWQNSSVKDMALDVVFYRPFQDNRQGFPYFLIQCASGADWKDKRNDPDLGVWEKITRSDTKPMRGFAIPFCISEIEFRQSCQRVKGLLLDRCRLLGAGNINEEWLAKNTSTRINRWAKDRIERLLELSN